MGTGSFPVVKPPGRGADHTPPSKRRGHEKVELYLYSPSGPQWPVIGRIFIFTFTRDPVNKVVGFDRAPFRKLKDLFFADVHGEVTSGHKLFNVSQIFHHFLDRMSLYSNTCRNIHDSRDSIRLISLSTFSLFLSVAVRGRPLRGRSAKLCVTFFKMFYSGSDRSNADSRFSIYTLQPCVNILWRNSLLN